MDFCQRYEFYAVHNVYTLGDGRKSFEAELTRNPIYALQPCQIYFRAECYPRGSSVRSFNAACMMDSVTRWLLQLAVPVTDCLRLRARINYERDLWFSRYEYKPPPAAELMKWRTAHKI